MRTRETYYSAPITRCVLSRRRQLQALFWLGVDAGLLLGVTGVLAYLLIVRVVAPEWIEEARAKCATQTQEVRP
jgi:hypothetical protein